jgi:protein-S-isoprenylcysteine O-methyltransferase Ste14
LALKEAAARIAYGAMFCVIVPLLLVLWARASVRAVHLPGYGDERLGAALCAAGAALLLAGMAALWRKGGGLPMNAFPPRRLVVSGVYRFVPHPIYSGFCLLCFGTAMAAGSPSGLWLVSPVVTLGCAALVFGHEVPDLERRFGYGALKGLRRLPPATCERPCVADALRFYLLALVPWTAIYEIGARLDAPSHAVRTTFAVEARLPVWPWTEILYFSVYPAALLAPMLIRTRRDLRDLTIRLWVSMAAVLPLYFCVPTVAPWRPLPGDGLLQRMMTLERAADMPAEALPSYHVIWAVLAAEAMAGSRRMKWPFRLWAALASAACVMTGVHSVADVIAGALIAFALLLVREIWAGMLRVSEAIANSWREWHVGPVRMINHGMYAGAGTFIGVLIVATLAGPSHWTEVGATAVAGLVGAGLWAQWVEGSPRLLRPYGYYGGVFGVMLASAFCSDPWLMMAAYSVGGPWIQAVGRLRCLVQGCCHGRPSDPSIGIRYLHARSRVCRLSGLRGVPIHPTPLYSILWNVPVALVVTRLWFVGSSLALIGGVYLILTGIGRFAEEAWRGEPQTPVFAGLRLYQWIAVATVVAGAAITSAPCENAPQLAFTPAAALIAGVFGILSALALGLDFPESNRRFARLA